MSNTMMNWIDLRDRTDGAKLKFARMTDESGQRRMYIFVMGLRNDSNRWANAEQRLGFLPSAGRKYLVRQVMPGERIEAKWFHSVWPNASLAQMPVSDVVIDLKPTKRLREDRKERTEEEQSVAMEAGAFTRLGRNADGHEVFAGPMGRHVRTDDGRRIEETDLLGPATFLRAPDAAALDRCADGFVSAMLHGEVQHSEDLDRFIEAVRGKKAPFSEQEYDEIATVIDAALVRHLHRSYDTAQDAYGDANRLYDYLPPYRGNSRGDGAMPLPLSVVAQRLLGDTSDRVVLVPNAWDGASFAFLSRGTKIRAFRGAKALSQYVGDVRAEDVSWAASFDPAREQGADGLFFNADPDRGPDGERKDYRQALNALRTLNPDARAVVVLTGDDAHDAGAIAADSLRFLDALSRRYEIETVFELGAEMTNRVGTSVPMRVFAVRNRPAASQFEIPERLTVLHSWDEVKSHVDEVIATAKVREAEAQSIEVDRVGLDNDFQRPYVSFSKVGEARTMVPKNLQGPLQFALSQLEKVHGPVDSFVERELGFGENTLGERFSPEQVDAIGLGLNRMKTGRGIIIGDETGIGKGRILSGFCTWASKQGKPVIFVTDRANLFSDLVRDLRDIGEFGRFRPLVMNADGVLSDVFTGETLQEGTPAKVMNKIMEDRMTLAQLGANIIFTTYSQTAGEDSPKADWILQQADDALVVVDEAHVAAGSNSNTSMFVAELVNRAWATVYSSATWAKSSENLHIYSRAFPETINIGSLTQTMRTGGEAFSEVFSAMLSRDGAFIRREHDLSKIEFSFDVDTKRRERNESLSDKMAAILAAMTYVSGDIGKVLSRMNSDAVKRLKDARDSRVAAQSAIAEVRAEELREAAAAGVSAPRSQSASLMRASFGAGSVLYQVMRRFLSVLNADNIHDLALQAIEENCKPVIVFEDTGESYLKRIIARETIPGVDGEPDTAPGAVRMPTIRDLMQVVLQRLQVVSAYDVDEESVEQAARDLVAAGEGTEQDDAINVDEVAERALPATSKAREMRVLDLPGLTAAQRDAYRKGMEEIIQMVEQLPPIPLNAVDLLQARLRANGLRVGEISGRSMRLEADEKDANLPIDDEGWNHAMLKIVPRSKKKADVNKTVFAFNNGDLDVVFINTSGATGISMHSSPRFADQRRRVLIEMQIPENPTQRIQLLGRVNRYDQVVTPRLVIPTSGIYGEVRQLMMQNKKLARLSANVRSSRDNAAEIRDVPDLLNSVGREVCKRFLEDNGGIRSRIGITEAQVENGYDLASLLTQRVALLSVAEQRMVYEELYASFDDTLMRYELKGENPLKPREKDIRAKTLSCELVLGMDMGGFGSAFDGPVYLRQLQWTESKRPFTWRQVVDMVREGREKMVADGLGVPFEDAREVDRSEGVAESNQAPQLVAGIPVEDGRVPAAVASGVDILNSATGSLGGVSFSDESEEGDGSALGDQAAGLLTPLADHEVGHSHARPAEELSRGEQSLKQRLGFTSAQKRAIHEEEASIPRVKFGEIKTKLEKIMAAKVQIELAGTNHKTVEAALAVQGKLNGVQRAYAKSLWVKERMGEFVPGALVGIPPSLMMQEAAAALEGSEGFYEYGIVVGWKVPPKGKEAMLSRWKIEVAFPGSTNTSSFSLGALLSCASLLNHEGTYRSGSSLSALPDVMGLPPEDVGRTREAAYVYERRDNLMASFHRDSSRSLTRKGFVLDGNMYLASEWASASKMGSGVIYTDDRGVRHRGVWLDNIFGMGDDLMRYMPVRLWSRDMVSRFMGHLMSPQDGAGVPPNGPSGTYLIPTSLVAATPRGQANSELGTRVMILPGKGIAMTLDSADVARVARALRGYQKSMVKRLHPDFAQMDKEQQKAALQGLVSIKTSTKKRGVRPMVLLECETVEHFDQAAELLCAAAGIELYLPKGSELGDLALRIQQDCFRDLRDQAIRAMGMDPEEVRRREVEAAGQVVEETSAEVDQNQLRLRA